MGFSPSAQLDTSTLNNWLTEKVEPIFRKSVFMGGLKAHGRISYKNSGKTLIWHPRVKRHKISAADAYNVAIAFPAFPRKIKAELEWVSYNLGEKLTKFDRLANAGGKVQLANLFGDMLTVMSEDFTDDLAEKAYSNGGAAGSLELMGMESMFAINGLIANSFLGDPNDTYAGHDTDLGAIGGDWTGTYPDGAGDAEYCAWSPFVFDINNSLYGGTTNTWADCWQQILNRVQAYMGRLQRFKPDIFLCDTDLLVQAGDSLLDKERFIATPSSKLVSSGFKTLMFNNLEVADEYACTPGAGYAFRWEDIELRSMQSQLVGYDNDHVIESSEDLKAIDFYGQMKFQTPARFAKVVGIAGGS